MALGKGAVGPPEMLLDRPKRLVRVWVVMEPRRGRLRPSVGGLFSWLPLDMTGDEGGMLRGKGGDVVCVYLQGRGEIRQDPQLLSSALVVCRVILC